MTALIPSGRSEEAMRASAVSTVARQLVAPLTTPSRISVIEAGCCAAAAGANAAQLVASAAAAKPKRVPIPLM
jgi:hypothetical protein